MDGETLFLLEMLLTLGLVVGWGAFELWRLNRARDKDKDEDEVGAGVGAGAGAAPPKPPEERDGA